MVATMKAESMPMIFATIVKLSIGPSVLTNQRDESATAVVLFPASGFCLDDSYQPLSFTRFADGYDETTANFQLRNQGLRHCRTTRGHQDRVVRRVSGPAERA